MLDNADEFMSRDYLCMGQMKNFDEVGIFYFYMFDNADVLERSERLSHYLYMRKTCFFAFFLFFFFILCNRLNWVFICKKLVLLSILSLFYSTKRIIYFCQFYRPNHCLFFVYFIFHVGKI